MINYEQMQLANGSTYSIAPNGIWENAEKTKIRITVLAKDKTLSEIDKETDNPENTDVINILDPYGDIIDIKKGYKYQRGCRKEKGYVVGRESIDTGNVDDSGDPILEYQDILDTVFVIELETSDIRRELEEAKKKIDSLNEAVDMLIIDSLEVK